MELTALPLRTAVSRSGFERDDLAGFGTERLLTRTGALLYGAHDHARSPVTSAQLARFVFVHPRRARLQTRAGSDVTHGWMSLHFQAFRLLGLCF